MLNNFRHTVLTAAIAAMIFVLFVIFSLTARADGASVVD